MKVPNLRTPPPPLQVEESGLALSKSWTVRLHPRRGATQLLDSKMGGVFGWKTDTPWPTCDMHGGPLLGVLQLRRHDLESAGAHEQATRLLLRATLSGSQVA